MFSLLLSAVISTQQVLNEYLVNKWMHRLMAFSYLLRRPWSSARIMYNIGNIRINQEEKALCFQGLFPPLIRQNSIHSGSSHLLFPLPGCSSHRYGAGSYFLHCCAQIPSQPGGFPDRQYKTASLNPVKRLSVSICHTQKNICNIRVIVKAWW